MQERSELARCVEAPRSQIAPGLFLEDGAVEFVVPEDIEGLTLAIVVGGGEAHERGLPWPLGP